MSTINDIIQEAERILRGPKGEDPNSDPRWQAIILVAEFAETNPVECWDFARRWGSSADEDLRVAIGACLLEHLLQYHFAEIFPKVARLARDDRRFADTFLSCWEFGQTEERHNAAQFNALKAELRSRADC